LTLSVVGHNGKEVKEKCVGGMILWPCWGICCASNYRCSFGGGHWSGTCNCS